MNLYALGAFGILALALVFMFVRFARPQQESPVRGQRRRPNVRP
jgi:hypothetical protein